MVPLVKNHYDIYNTRTTSISQHDSGYLLSASSQLSGLSNSNKLRTNSTNGKSSSNQTVVLNGLVLMNGRTNAKPKVILSARNGKKQQQKSSQQSSKKLTSEVQPNSNEQQKQQQQSQNRLIKKQPSPMSYSTSTQSMNTTRSFPHVRRTVRNPITKRVYSYSVSIPEYVAEEDEEEVAALELEDEQRDDHLDQMLIFSTSAPAGTGSIDNGIIDVVDEDEFIRCTGARLPTAISNHRRSSKQLPLKSSSSRNECNHLTKLPKNNENTENNNGNFLESSDDNDNGGSTTPTSPGSASTSSSSNVEYENCPSANSREYMELLQKFILHLKMLKLKRLFKNKNRSTNSSKDCNNEQRSRSSTLDDSNNL